MLSARTWRSPMSRRWRSPTSMASKGTSIVTADGMAPGPSVVDVMGGPPRVASAAPATWVSSCRRGRRSLSTAELPQLASAARRAVRRATKADHRSARTRARSVHTSQCLIGLSSARCLSNAVRCVCRGRESGPAVRPPVWRRRVNSVAVGNSIRWAPPDRACAGARRRARPARAGGRSSR